MARRPSSGKSKGGQRGGSGYGGSGGGDGDNGGEGEGREPFREEEGAVRVHEAYLKHRLGGGAPATPQAYARALQQFNKLPGAVRSKPARSLREPPPDLPGDDDDEKKR